MFTLLLFLCRFYWICFFFLLLCTRATLFIFYSIQSFIVFGFSTPFFLPLLFTLYHYFLHYFSFNVISLLGGRGLILFHNVLCLLYFFLPLPHIFTSFLSCFFLTCNFLFRFLVDFLIFFIFVTSPFCLSFQSLYVLFRF